MTWFKSKAKCKACQVISVNIVHDKRLCNTLICHQDHLLICYRYEDVICSSKVLYDDAFYLRYKSGEACQVLADDKNIWHL
ncbi:MULTISPECIES: hypothetical protein [Pseudoalteromonas]|uniref:Uncharacterized protein n=1 Tax=Pseudoalteromonas obscura TaxID=3048491 RepID=A0ABT7EFL6_9GAMM|nr:MULTISPECIES: hypothetical protein [Pseudoalteromonas]MBQ4835673.1 hypothetical protein [Pseudoalteromonas luteoviolacea]MCG7549287.1 hypothetical protein [Pseudoalteromonas sp. Of7M-16]MDK2594074.1 hypothetical protein [Pseudoalteromonas sp. P94(2023)]